MSRCALWLVGALLSLLMGFAIDGVGADAETPETAGCEGLAAYDAAMMAAGEAWSDAMTDDGLVGRDPFTYSPAEWLAFGEHTADAQVAIKAITPPTFAADWHRTQIEGFGAVSALALSVGTTGALAALAYGDTFDEIGARRSAAREAAIAACPAFADFLHRWDGLDGVGSTATPESKP